MSQTLKIAEKTVVTTTTTTTRYVDDPDGPPAKREEKLIPLLDDEGHPIVFTFEPSDGPQVKSFDLRTAGISYVDARLLGFKLTPSFSRGENGDGFPNQDILLKIDVETLAVCGYANALMAPVDCPIAPYSPKGEESIEYRGLRMNDDVQKTNTVTARVTIRQQIAHKHPIAVAVAMAAIVDIVEDSALAR